MEYEGRICRGPMERASYMLPVSVGCSYNACRFCELFKHLKYRDLPLEQIEQELQRVKDAGGAPATVYLGDGNAFGTDFDRLVTILRLVHRYFPDVQRINMDATVTNISEKTDEQLSALRALNVGRLYLGIETGLDDVLVYMNKDHKTMASAEEQIMRLKAAGMTWAAHIMTGVAGHGRGIENAEALAAFLNRTQPAAIINFSMFLHRRSSIYTDIRNGIFTPADEVENMREQRRLLELLELDSCDFDGMHDMLEVRVRGHLPRDREKMLKKNDEAIAQYEHEEPVIALVR